MLNWPNTVAKNIDSRSARLSIFLVRLARFALVANRTVNAFTFHVNRTSKNHYVSEPNRTLIGQNHALRCEFDRPQFCLVRNEPKFHLTLHVRHDTIKNSIRRVRRVEPMHFVELVEQNGSTHSTRQARYRHWL